MSIAAVCSARAQVYQVGAGASKKPQTSTAQSPSGSQQQLGWGSNIQNARLGRAAQAALQRGDHRLALSYAQRAAEAAPGDPQLWFLFGYAARLNGDYSLAVNAYNHGLKLSPNAPDGLSGLAQVFSMTGRNQDAERLLKQAISAHPDRTSDVLLLGDLYMRAKDYGQAVNWLQKAETLRPDARSELLLAICYQHSNQMELASHFLNLAKQKAPNNPDVERSLAGYYREIGKYPEAIAALRTIRNPKPDVVAELAYTYQLDGKMKDSAKLYREAADAETKNLDLQLAAAQAAVVAGLMDEAGSLLNRAALLDANSYRLHAIKGEMDQIEGKDEDAAHEYQAAITSLPAVPAEGPLYGIQLHMDLVALYGNLNDKHSAQHELGIAQAQIASVNAADVDRAKYLRLKSLIELNAGEFDQALKDVNGALANDEHDRDDLQLKGDILMKLGRTNDAMAAYKQVLAADPNNRFALISMGYACRAAGRDRDAVKYFEQLAKADPTSSAPYLALGDLYTAHKQYPQAEAAYARGYTLNPQNALIVAGGLNASVESHQMSLGGVWMKRVTSRMKHNPYVLREEERYLSFDGRYNESATVGRQAIGLLPNDRDVVVYLGYDLLHMQKYDELLALTTKYLDILPKEPDIPLLEGYVHKHNKQDSAALKDFDEVLKRDPSVVTAYVNRGFVLNDLHQPQEAAASFEEALKREPDDGEAHLGLAYADLDLNKPEAALRQSQLSEKVTGDSRDVHVIRATAYGREGMLSKAAVEYQAALRFTPGDSQLHFGLGNTLFSEHRYQPAIDQLQEADKLAPGDAYTYALLARAYASLQDADQTMHYVRLAEQRAARHVAEPGDAAPVESQILLSTGDALSTLGYRDAAMDRFRKALNLANGDRVGVRLAIAQLMVQQNQSADAEREVALAWMEVDAGDARRPTGAEYIAAADIFRSLHDYQQSQSYLERAKAAGAPDDQVRIGLATNDLALGETTRAEAELNAVKTEQDGPGDFQYLMARANVYRQKHQNAKALTAFAQAANAAGDDQAVQEDILQTGADEGYRITPNVSLLSNVGIAPIFEDTTVYVLDSKLDAAFAVPAYDTGLLPPPRSSIQTQWTNAFHLHIGNLPTPGGFFQLRNARGQISVPGLDSVVSRNTTDAIFNFGMSPTVHIGDNVLAFTGGVQETIRRDSVSPAAMNQNLFRVFAYLSTSSFFNAVSMNGYLLRETGPFTETQLHSRTLAGAVNFRVGAPWSKSALLTGWGVNDQWFKQANIENYYSSSYVGIEHSFSHDINVQGILDYERAWRGFGPRWGIAQALRPAVGVDFSPARNWTVHVSGAYSNNRGFHVYDAVQSGIHVSYSWPFRRLFNATSGEVAVQYPIQFSAGLQQETFYNFPGPQSRQFRPYVQINIF